MADPVDAILDPLATELIVDATTMQDHVAVVRALEPFVKTQLVLLKPVKETWQPSDVLPNLTGERWPERVHQLRAQAQGLSDAILVVIVGDMVTEEALPAYQTMLNRHVGMTDRTGASDSPWAQWTRGWTAEENRHGEALATYLYLSGRVDMRAVEITTQHLIRQGFDAQTENDPYCGLIYTSFQERATRISHGGVAQLAMKCGDPTLGNMCNLIAGDEARHEEAYKRFIGKIAEGDPSGMVVAFAKMMRTKIVMPGRLMYDGVSRTLFEQFAAVAQRLGVYSIRDYANIIHHLVTYWKIPQMVGLHGQAAAAQTYLCGLAQRYLTLADRLEGQIAQQPKTPFHWIFDRVA